MADYSSVASSSSYFYSMSIERMMAVAEEEADAGAEIDTDTGADGPTPIQLVTMWYPRAAGSISFLSALCMLWMAWKRRNLLFHRLVLGMSFHLMVFGACYIVGALAIPSDDRTSSINQLGTIGNVATCTAQGFFIYVSARVAVLYYGSFSVYSYVGVLNNFDKTKYQWCEKWIHILVHIYPVGMAFYLLTVQGFNPGYGFCKAASYPLGCTSDGDIPCERGPGMSGRLEMILHWVAPILSMVLFPTFVMTALYWKVKKREQLQQRQLQQQRTRTRTQSTTTQQQPVRICIIKAKKVLLQSCVYLSALYWTMAPFFVFGIMNFLYGRRDKSRNGLIPYVMFAQFNYALFGLWSMLTYRYFSVVGSASSRSIDNNNNNNQHKNKNSNNGRGISERNQHSENNSTTEYIFNAEEQQQQPGAVIENSSSCPPISTTTTTTTTAVTRTTPVLERQYSVNIFDGTNAKGAFADFIHDGDSDDELADIEEAERWSAVQDHI